MKLERPYPSDRRVTSPFGYRWHPIHKKRALHRGIDISGSFKITAPAPGRVVHIGWAPKGGGHTVIIEHGPRLFTAYYHLKYRTHLRKGQRVDTFADIGFSGSTGSSTGDHLHFECRTSRRWGTQKDPEIYFTKKSRGGDALVVNGRMTAAVWRVWQTQLNQSGHYKAAKIDGRPGRLTYSAIQSFVGTPVTGRLSTQDKKAVQRYLEKCGYMVGKIDGRWGRMTYTALQKSLNESKWFEKKEGEC